MSFRFIHSADMHLGSSLSVPECEFDDNFKECCREAVYRSFNTLINYALSQKVDFVLFSGDTFDSVNQTLSAKIMFKEGLKRLETAKIPSYIICGNHDALNSFKKEIFNFSSEYIKIVGLNTKNPLSEIVFNNNGEKIAHIHAYSYETKQCSINPIHEGKYASKDDDLFNIGMLHTELKQDGNYAPCSVEDLSNQNYDYWALGHIHSYVEVSKNIFYSGTPQGRDFGYGEMGEHSFNLVEVDDNNSFKVSRIYSDSVRYKELTVSNLTNVFDISDVVSAIHSEILCCLDSENTQSDYYSLRVNLCGTTNSYSGIESRKEDIENEVHKLIKKVYISSVNNNTTLNVDTKLLKSDEGIIGEIYKTVESTDFNEMFEEIKSRYASVLKYCDSSKIEEYKMSIIENAKQKCIEACSQIYFGQDNK